MRLACKLCFLSILVSTFMLIAPLFAAEVAKEVTELQIEFVDKTFFTDRIATVQIQHAAPLTLVNEDSFTGSGIKLINVRSQKSPQKNSESYQTYLSFLPQKTGPIQFPALCWESSAGLINTRAIDFIVDTPSKSLAMQLSIRAHKAQVFIGEPLKISLEWSGTLEINRLQELKLYPDFFDMEGIEVVIPRSTAPPDAQIGLPLGGRRILAHRRSPSPKQLGKVQLDLFLRFHQTGHFKFKASRLECGLLPSSNRRFAPYAAHFNNALFEPINTQERHERIYVDSEAFEVQVVALPANTSEHPFTGLFTPINFVATTPTSEVTVGQLISLNVNIDSQNCPHEWLRLPKSQLQNQLNGHFWVDQNLNQFWRAEGSRYETRLRALSTQVPAIPELEFLCFDTTTKSYQLKTSPAIPLKVQAAQAQNFIPLSTFLVDAPPLRKQTEGIWYPRPRIHSFTMFSSLIANSNQYFFPILACLIALFAIIFSSLVWSQKYSSDRYSKTCKRAYRRFQKRLADDPQKWTDFLEFLALSLQVKIASLTKEEALHALKTFKLSSLQLSELELYFRKVDEQTYSPRPHKINFRKLEPIAKAIRQQARRLNALILVLTASLAWQPMEASPYTQAMEQLQQAERAELGSRAARLLYTEAALQFESLAQDPHRAAEAWPHAGHAWFQAQALGRALAAYRIAHSYHPFDDLIQENIQSIRALVNDAQSARQLDHSAIPTRWLRPVLLLIITFFFSSLLLWFHGRNRISLYSFVLMTPCLMFTASVLTYRAWKPLQEGVVIARSTEARKGPGYHFTPAFNEAVREGTEFNWIHQEKDWYFVQLHSGSECWLHHSQIKIFEL